MKSSFAQNRATSSIKSMVCAIIMGFASTWFGIPAMVMQRSRVNSWQHFSNPTCLYKRKRAPFIAATVPRRKTQELDHGCPAK